MILIPETLARKFLKNRKSGFYINKMYSLQQSKCKDNKRTVVTKSILHIKSVFVPFVVPVPVSLKYKMYTITYM